MLKPYLNQLLVGKSLSEDETKEAMQLILKDADPCQTAAFLAMIKLRGESAEEVAGMIGAIETASVPVSIAKPVLDIVGTGGDQANTVNISTGSAILASACGIPIAKHGNRSVSSQSGSADVLEALGIRIDMGPAELVDCIHAVNIGFMFAPLYHPALARIRAIRNSLKIPTTFNLLGPLLNPAQAPFVLIGVAKASAVEVMTQSVMRLNRVKRGLIFHGNGLDELSPLGTMTANHIVEGRCERLVIDPEALGISRCTLADLQGGAAPLNARLLLQAFSGQRSAIADALILNAGAALWVYGAESSIQAGVDRAREALINGAAAKQLENWKQFGRRTDE